jgi:hypothetical protein
MEEFITSPYVVGRAADADDPPDHGDQAGRQKLEAIGVAN